MAKGSAMGLWRGKKGSSVFYKIANSNSAQKQGIRERNYEVSNPQTAAQASQRMKLLPAQRVYGVLKDTIERSWQGVPYGEKARQEFLKLALREDVFPAVDKGSPVVVPGPYYIAKGSLPEIITSIDDDSNVTFNFNFARQLAEMTVKQFSRELLASSSVYKEGDQFTFVLAYYDSSTSRGDSEIVVLWHVASFYLSLSNDTPLNDYLPAAFEFESDAPNLKIEWPTDLQPLAGACIVSRDAATPLRSTARLAVDTSTLSFYFSAAAMRRARASYMRRPSTAQSDWPVDPAIDPNVGNIVTNVVTLDPTGSIATGVTGGSVSGAGNYEIGDDVTLQATPRANYHFNGWFRSQADAVARENAITTDTILTFTAGDTSVVGSTTTFYASFQGPFE